MSYSNDNKPSATRGISSLDGVGNVGDLAGSLSSVSSGQPSQTYTPSSTTSGSQYTSGSPNVKTSGSGSIGSDFSQSNLPSNFNPSDPGASLNSAGQGSFTSSGTNLSQGSSFGSTTGIPGDSAGSSGLSGNSSQFGVSSSSTAGSVGKSPSTNASQTASNAADQARSSLSNTTEQVRSSLPSTEQVKSSLPSTEQIKSNIPSAEQVKANIPSAEQVKASAQQVRDNFNRTDVNVGPPSGIHDGLNPGVQTTSGGGNTPGGIVKGQDHVESLVAGIGGILLTAPLAAGEFIAGKVHHHADRAREVANQQGLGNVAEATSGLMQNVSNVAQQKVNQLNASRGPDAAPISQTISDYATSAAQSAQALAAQAVHTAQGLAGRAQENAPSTGQVKETANNAANQTSQAAGGIGATLNSYIHSAQDAAANLAHQVQDQAQHLGERVGLTSPHTATHPTGSTDAPTSSSTGTTSSYSGSGSSGLSGISQSTTPSSGNLSSDNTVSGRYDLSQGEIPSETVTKTSTEGIQPPTSSSNPFNTDSVSSSNSNNPFTGHASGATLPSQTQSSNSGATGSVEERLGYPDSIAQPGAASYGQGKLGSGQEYQNTTSL